MKYFAWFEREGDSSLGRNVAVTITASAGLVAHVRNGSLHPLATRRAIFHYHVFITTLDVFSSFREQLLIVISWYCHSKRIALDQRPPDGVVVATLIHRVRTRYKSNDRISEGMRVNNIRAIKIKRSTLPSFDPMQTKARLCAFLNGNFFFFYYY